MAQASSSAAVRRDPSDYNAVVMLHDYEYNPSQVAHTAANNAVPREFLTSTGLARLLKGEHGWAAEKIPDDMWYLCRFERGDAPVCFMVPKTYLSIGAKQKVFTSPHFRTNTGARTWIRRTIPATPFMPELHRFTTGCAMGSICKNKNKSANQDAEIRLAPDLKYTISDAVIEQTEFKLQQSLQLWFDITADLSRYPRPWVRVPDVGLYDNFATASSLAMYIDSHDEEADVWTETQIFSMDVLGPVNKDGINTPQAWLKSMKMIMLLEGIQLDSTSEHFPQRAYSVASMQYAEYDHLQQTLSWTDVTHPRKTIPIPKLMSFERNADLLISKFPDLPIGMSQRPDRIYLGSARKACDFCVWNAKQMWQSKCEGDTRACDPCKTYLNRPCTWTFDMRALPESTLDRLLYRRGHVVDGKSMALAQRTIPKPSGGERLMEILSERSEGVD
ncbi:Uu.00g121300.m01.CDS01 [Anthostomella pinea]|uniref:Uu.00g121300.m01.CDS01 n=1 Tax=Anthostomella pinea TaxID=933095 RepID=A0AAI8VHN8_9PEZI|nr:Uu.00g121300.m01.CDS01 [Anthostomella pinea]